MPNTFTKIEKENLDLLMIDVSMTLDKYFQDFDSEVKKFLSKTLPFFVIFYFKVLRHDPKNKLWEHKDEVFFSNNLFLLMGKVLEAHLGYENFNNLLSDLKQNQFGTKKNNFKEAIALCKFNIDKSLSDEANVKNIIKKFFVITSQEDIIKNTFINELDYIGRKKLSQIVMVIFVRGEFEDELRRVSYSNINIYDRKEKNVLKHQDHKLNAKLHLLGYDTYVVDGKDLESLYNTFLLAMNTEIINSKNLDSNKPKAILINMS